MDRYVLGTDEGAFAVFKQGSSPASTHKLNEAKKFSDKVSALKMMSTIPKAMRSIGNWHPILVDDIIEPITQNAQYKEFNIDEVYKSLDEQIDSLRGVVGNRKILENALKSLELIELDLRHYAEFNKLNAAEGYEVYKMFHVLWNKRREIKDKLDTIDFFETAKFVDVLNGDMKKKSDAASKRKYKVRTETAMPLFKAEKLSRQLVDNVCEEIGRIV